MILTKINMIKNENTNLLHYPGNKVITSILAATGAALCLTLTSCIIPVDGNMQSSTGYTTYQPGYRIKSLPYGYRSENISGQTYYYYDGTYYRRDSNGYITTDAPRESRYYKDYDRLYHNRSTDRTYVR
jgi:hypothetical protein